MDNQEKRDPMSEITGRLYDFARSINGDVIVKGADVDIEKDNLRASIHIDPMGKVSFELFDGGEQVLIRENTDIDTIFENIEGRAFPDEQVEERKAA